MKNKSILPLLSTMIAGTSLFGAISLDTVSSSTATVGTSDGAYFTQAGNGTGSAYAAFLNAGGGVYNFGWANNQTTFSSVNDFDIAGLHGADGEFTVNFDLDGGTGISHIAYTGGGLTGLDYRFSDTLGPSGDGTETGSLSLTFAPTTAAASASNGAGGQTLFGLSIFTSSDTATEPYFSGAAFGTDMYWGDIALQQTGSGYGDTLKTPGANFDGQDGSTANFDFYIAQDVLLGNLGTNADPISSGDGARFQFNKADGAASFAVDPDSVTFYDNGNPDDDVDGFADGLTTETSTFNFGAAEGTDNTVLFEVSNDQWSDANILLGSVPEPRAYGLLAGAVAFVWVAGRRRRKA